MEASGFITAKQVKTTAPDPEGGTGSGGVNTDLEKRGSGLPETRGSNWASAGEGASDAIHS